MALSAAVAVSSLLLPRVVCSLRLAKNYKIAGTANKMTIIMIPNSDDDSDGFEEVIF